MELVGALLPGEPPRPSSWQACSAPSPCCTRSASPPGRTPSSAPRVRLGDVRRRLPAAATRTCSPPASWARCGGSATGAWSSSTSCCEARDRLTRRALPATSVKIMQDGVAENHTAAMLSPYLRRAAAARPAAPRRALVRRPRGPARLRHRARRPRLPGALPRPRRPCGARGAGRGRGRTHRQRLQRQPPPPRPPPGRPPRRHRRFRDARRHRQHPAALGRARAADGRADHPVPRPGAAVVAVPVRRPAPRRRDAGGAAATGRSAARTRSRACTWRSTGSPPSGDAEAFLPEQRLDLASALAAYTSGSAYVNHLDDTGTIAVGQARRPRRPRPRPVRRAARGDRPHPGGADVRRRSTRLRRVCLTRPSPTSTDAAVPQRSCQRY